MNDENIANRLKVFIESEGLSYSQFADTCGIARPSLSQFLTGRNKKVSNTFVEQIHTAFPNLNINWFLFGEGDMLVDDFNSSSAEQDFSSSALEFVSHDNDFSNSLFSLSFSEDDNREIPTPVRTISEDSKENGLSLTEKYRDLSDKEIVELKNKISSLETKIENLKKNPRRVVQIMIYYDDSTFETFIPRQ